MTRRTADLSDEHGPHLQACSLQWRSLGRIHDFTGPASTLRCRDDNATVRAAVSEPGNGRVLVVDGAGSLDCALVGDVLAGLAVVNGWVGIVVNGAARDVVALDRLDVGVLALGTRTQWTFAGRGRGWGGTSFGSRPRGHVGSGCGPDTFDPPVSGEVRCRLRDAPQRWRRRSTALSSAHIMPTQHEGHNR